jgi:hypothetical protein
MTLLISAIFAILISAVALLHIDATARRAALQPIPIEDRRHKTGGRQR